jgi:hypothetical protein
LYDRGSCFWCCVINCSLCQKDDLVQIFGTFGLELSCRFHFVNCLENEFLFGFVFYYSVDCANTTFPQNIAQVRDKALVQKVGRRGYTLFACRFVEYIHKYQIKCSFLTGHSLHELVSIADDRLNERIVRVETKMFLP